MDNELECLINLVPIIIINTLRDRKGILFEWNNEMGEHQEHLIEDEPVLHPSMVAEFPGVTLDHNLMILTIEEEFETQNFG